MTTLLNQIRDWNLGSVTGYRIEVVSDGEYWLTDSNFLRVYKLPTGTDDPCYVADKYLTPRVNKNDEFTEKAIQLQKSAQYSLFIDRNYGCPMIVERSNDVVTIWHDFSDYAVSSVRMPDAVDDNLERLIESVAHYSLIESNREKYDVGIDVQLANGSYYTVTLPKLDMPF